MPSPTESEPLSEFIVNFLASRHFSYVEGLVPALATIKTTLIIPAAAKDVVYSAYVAEMDGPWRSPGDIGWCWWVTSSDDVAIPDRRITYTLYNQSHNRTRRVRIESSYRLS